MAQNIVNIPFRPPKLTSPIDIEAPKLTALINININYAYKK